MSFPSDPPTPLRTRGKKRNRKLVRSHQSQIGTSPKRPKFLKPKEMYQPAMPTLQGLPQELLESIFLYSMNISLPRASPDLGRRLSSKWVTLEYTMRTFFHTVDHPTPIKKDVGKPWSNKSLQSSVLACRFFTWPFFLSYVSRAHTAIIKLRGKAWESTTVQIPGVEQFTGTTLWPFKFTKIDYLGFAEGFRVPEKLLRGPWTEEKGKLLYVLVAMHGELDWENSMAGETAREGLRHAIEEGNERAVAALAVLVGVGRGMTTAILRHAVVECGCDFALLRHLLFNAQILHKEANRGLLDLHDPVLWQWADGRGAESEKGEVLKEMLRRAEIFELEFYWDGEGDWAAIVPFPYSGDKFDARAPLGNRTRELLKRLYKSYGRRITMSTRRRETEVPAAEHVEETVVA